MWRGGNVTDRANTTLWHLDLSQRSIFHEANEAYTLGNFSKENFSKAWEGISQYVNLVLCWQFCNHFLSFFPSALLRYNWQYCEIFDICIHYGRFPPNKLTHPLPHLLTFSVCMRKHLSSILSVKFFVYNSFVIIATLSSRAGPIYFLYCDF